MASQIAILSRTRSLLKALTTTTTTKSISTFSFLSQSPQLAESPPQPDFAPLPPNPSSLRRESPAATIHHAVAPPATNKLQALARTMDLQAVLEYFSAWTASQQWEDLKQVFEFWVRSMDRHGRPNKPDVGLYNLYLRANLMLGASAGELLDMLAGMEGHGVEANTASFNLVLKAMYSAREVRAAEKLIERMLEAGKESLPDDETYAIVIGMLCSSDQIDSAIKYIDLSMKSGHVLSMKAFNECIQGCLKQGKLDILLSIIERSETMEQSKALCPSWSTCKVLAEAAMQEGNSKLAFHALRFMYKWISRGKVAKPPVHLSIDEGLVVSALATAGNTYNPTLLDASWQLLHHSLLNKKAPNPETYIAKIYAYASLGNLKKAFHTLKELEQTYVNSDKETEDLFSPFTSLYPLVVACSKNGFETLDSVYYELEKWNNADPPYKSVAALNCIIVGCANTWDLDRAYQTFEAISATFGLTPDIHSYNALMYAFGKLNKTVDATKVFEHFVSLGVKPNAKSYALLVDAHLINRDPNAAISVIDEMVTAGFVPSKQILKKVRRRSLREMNDEANDLVQGLAGKFQIRMGADTRRNLLFSLTYDTEYA